MKFSLTPPNLARVLDDQWPAAMWEYFVGYSHHAQKDPSRNNPRFTLEEWRAFDRSLPRGLRLVHSFMRFDGDFLNGGIVQYMGNHTRGDKPDAEVLDDLEALKTIGAVESAAVLEQAIAVYKRDYGWPSGDGPACGIEEEEHPDLVRLDHLRCNDESQRRDYALLNVYLHQHVDECISPVEVECDYLDGLLDPSKSKR